jgi:hypothetical protein
MSRDTVTFYPSSTVVLWAVAAAATVGIPLAGWAVYERRRANYERTLPRLINVKGPVGASQLEQLAGQMEANSNLALSNARTFLDRANEQAVRGTVDGALQAFQDAARERGRALGHVLLSPSPRRQELRERVMAFDPALEATRSRILARIRQGN